MGDLYGGPGGGFRIGMLNVVSSFMLGYIAVWLGAMLARC